MKRLLIILIVLMQPLAGGQALIEGVMMRNKEKVSAVVRKKDGTLSIKKIVFHSLTQTNKFAALPFIRGVFILGELMCMGVPLMIWSAQEASEDQKNKDLSRWETFALVAFSISFSILLFMLVPLALTYALQKTTSLIGSNEYMFNFIDGVLKIAIFVGYVWFVSLMPDVRRVFQYHGAEHKAIYTFENNEAFTPENADKHSRFHPRCGTSFIVFVLLISIVVFSFIPVETLWIVNFALRILLVPVIAGIGYEVLRYSAAHRSSKIWKMLIWPGLQVQHVTTQPPDYSQLEVGLKAMDLVIDEKDHQEMSNYLHQ